MILTRTTAAVVVALVLTAAAAPSEPAVADRALRLGVDDVLPAVVQVVQDVHGSLVDTRDNSVHGPYDNSFVGTGFFVSAAGDIVTAAHIADPTDAELTDELLGPYIDELHGCDPTTSPDGCAGVEAAHHDDLLPHVRQQTAVAVVSVLLQSMDVTKRGMPTALVTASQSTALDIAVVHVNGISNAPVAVVAPSPHGPSTPLAVIGYPPSPRGGGDTLVPTVTTGRVTHVLPPDPTSSVAPGANLVETDAVTREGNSGGPGITGNGEVDGVVSYGVSDTDNFLVASGDVRAVMGSLVAADHLGATDAAWRDGLAAEAMGNLAAAVADFNRCAALASFAVQCADHAEADAHASTTGTAVGRLVGIAAWGLLATVVVAATTWLVGRRRRPAPAPPWSAPPPPPPPPADG